MSISKFIARRFNRNNNLNVVSSQGGLPAAKPVATANARRRNRSINLNVESCEERIVPVAPVVGAIFSEVGSYAFGAIMDQFFKSDDAKFKEINDKLDKLTTSMTELKEQIKRLEISSSQILLNQITAKMEIPKIDSYWENMNKFVDLKLAKTPASKAEVKLLAEGITKELNHVITAFNLAFEGNRQNKPLMTAVSDIVKKTVVNKAGNTSDVFLDSNYTKAMVAAYDYYTSECAKAAILLVNAHEYLGHKASANIVRDQVPTPYAKGTAATRWTNQKLSLPHNVIPDYVMIDTGTNRAWSQFKIIVSGFKTDHSTHYTLVKSDIPDLFASQAYLNNPYHSPNLIHTSSEWKAELVNAGKAIRASGVFFTWHVPTKTDLGLPAEFYTSRGFNPTVYNSLVWTIDAHGVSQNTPGGEAVWMTNAKNRANAVFYANCKRNDFFV